MTNKRIRLPREGLIRQDDGTKDGANSEFIDTSQDVEGHSFPIPAPPIDFSQRGAGNGGEAIPNDDETGDAKAH